MAKPFFSIVIPALNEEKYLPHLLQDLSDQSYRDFEVIVVDGKSEDNTVQEVKKFARALPHLTILTSTKRHVCTQRNLGGKQAVGEYLVFMDADNRLPTYYLQGIKYQLELEPSDLLTTWLQPDIDNPGNNALATSFNLFFEYNFKFKPNFLLESMIIMRRHVFEVIKGFNEKTLVGEGKDLIHKIEAAGFSYRISSTPTYKYSFRRIRKYGAIGMAGRLAQNELLELFGVKQSSITKKLYPMKGGKLFDRNQHDLISRLNSVATINRRKFSSKITQLITILNTDIDKKAFPKLKSRLSKFLS